MRLKYWCHTVRLMVMTSGTACDSVRGSWEMGAWTVHMNLSRHGDSSKLRLVLTF